MKTKLIQLLDCEYEVLALYAYNGDLMQEEDAGASIDNAYGDALTILQDANPGEQFGPGDVEGDADEALARMGIERVHIDNYNSKHF